MENPQPYSLSDVMLAVFMNSSKIVIDKSYLHGGPKDELADIFSEYRVVMSEALFFELMTTTEQKRARCFKRIPLAMNPVLLLPDIAPLLKWEVENRAPLLDVEIVAINERFKLNGELTDEEFRLEPTESVYLHDWKQRVEIEVEKFKEFSTNVCEVFTGLEKYRPGSDTSLIDLIRSRVCEDLEITRYIYDCCGYRGWPSGQEIDDRWAIFRWWQIRILASLDLYKKHGKNIKYLGYKRIENEFHDLEYCLFASLCGRLATKDKGLAYKFKSVCTGGTLI